MWLLLAICGLPLLLCFGCGGEHVNEGLFEVITVRTIVICVVDEGIEPSRGSAFEEGAHEAIVLLLSEVVCYLVAYMLSWDLLEACKDVVAIYPVTRIFVGILSAEETMVAKSC